MSIMQVRLPWEVNWGNTHGEVVPKDTIRMVLNFLKPYQLLLATQVTTGWKKQINEEWALKPDQKDDQCLNKVRSIWKRYTENKAPGYTAREVEKVEKLSFRMKTVGGFTNEKFIEIISLYQNLFSRFQEFNLEMATYIFHQNFGMKKEVVTKIFLKNHPSSFDIQLGNLNYLRELPLESKQEFVRACIESNRVELVMTHMEAVTTYEQRNKIHDYFIDVLSGPLENISKMLFKGDMESILKDFFFQAQKELENNPNSLLSQKLRPVINSIIQGASDAAKNDAELIYLAFQAVKRLTVSFYCITGLFGWGWGMVVPQYLLWEGAGHLGGFVGGTIGWYLERTKLIFQLILLFPEYAIWKSEISHVCELYEIFLRTRISLEKSHYCVQSQKLLIHAVKAPDGKIYDAETLGRDLDEHPKKYEFSKKDLIPDFKKINSVYNDLIKALKSEVEQKRDSLGHQNVGAFRNFLTFSANFSKIETLLHEEKRRSYEKVYSFCTKAQKEYLRLNKKLKKDYLEGKISKQVYSTYDKYATLKGKIKFEYRYNLD